VVPVPLFFAPAAAAGQLGLARAAVSRGVVMAMPGVYWEADSAWLARQPGGARGHVAYLQARLHDARAQSGGTLCACMLDGGGDSRCCCAAPALASLPEITLHFHSQCVFGSYHDDSRRGGRL
jgi:hypothetical protein